MEIKLQVKKRQASRVSASHLWATLIKLSWWHLNGRGNTEHPTPTPFICTVYQHAWGSWKESSHKEAWKTRFLWTAQENFTVGSVVLYVYI